MGVYIFKPEDLIRYGSARPEQMELLKEEILAKRDVLIAGTSRSGKTKLVEALLHYVPEEWKVCPRYRLRRVQTLQEEHRGHRYCIRPEEH